MHINAHEYVSK